MSTTYILGAGFSIPVGYPSGQKLNQKFFENVENKILKFSSGEWSWDEHGEISANNGRLNFDYLNISYLLSELVEDFQKITFLPFDYEEFYDWINQPYSNSFIQKKCEVVNKRLLSEGYSQSSPHLFSSADINQYLLVQSCYEYLIADLLNQPYQRNLYSHLYSSFISRLENDELSNIFTLNHDTLLEFLLHNKGLKYSDGFSSIDSIIGNDQKEMLPVFNNEYVDSIKLFKLHGSIDYYNYSELIPTQGGVYQCSENSWFFKTDRYWDVHTAGMIDKGTKEIIQSLNTNIRPQFLTGKSKLSTINEHKIYKTLFEHLKNELEITNRIIIIGYSYRDLHINELLMKTIKHNSCEIVNVNPYISFPFRRNYSKKNITEIKSIVEL